MKYASEEQRKAVMASLRDRGLIYPELDDSYYSGLDYNCDWESDPQAVRKSIKSDLQKAMREKELNAERKQRRGVEEEIKQILSVKVLEEDKEKMLLSCRFNDVIRKAVQTGIDRNIIIKLREIQQQLVKNIPNKIIKVELQEAQRQMKLQETRQQLVKGIPRKLVKNIPKHVKCIYCGKLIKTTSDISYCHISHETYFICEKCGQKIIQS